MKAISIIMPVYQAKKTLPRAIDSLLNQTYKRFDLLLIDDGSTDGSAEICDVYAQKDKRIRVFHKPNGGASSARNVGLEHVMTEYVTFCDADDYASIDWLKSFMEDFDKADVVVVGAIYHDKNGNSYNVCPFSMLTDAQTSADTMSENDTFGYLWAKCFKTSIIRDHHLRFNEAYRFMEDEEFICRYWRYVRKVQFLDSVEYNYFLPDINRKYKDIDNYHLYYSLLMNASSFIPNDSSSITLRKYTMGCFRSMMSTYQRGDYRKALERLNDFVSYSDKYERHNQYMRIIKKWNYGLWHPFLIVYTLLKRNKSNG